VKSELEQARQARRILAKVHARLLRPTVETLDSGAEDLSAAAACLQQVEKSLMQDQRRGPERRALELEIAQVRIALERVQTLVVAAGRFHAGWGLLMASADDCAANYSAAGVPAGPMLVESSRVVMHG